MPRCRRDEGVYPGGYIQDEMPKMRYRGAEVALGRPQKLTTRAFEDSCCWLVLLVSKLACQKLLRILWRWVSAICSRVLARLNLAQPPRTADLRWIGVDETSYKKGHSYMSVVVNLMT